MNLIMWWFLEGSPNAQMRNLSRRLFHLNEGIKLRKKFAKDLAKLESQRPKYQVSQEIISAINNSSTQ